MRSGYIILVHTGNKPQQQRQTLTHNKGLEKVSQKSEHKKQPGVPYFKTKLIKNEMGEEDFILVTRKICQHCISVRNVYMTPIQGHPHS